MLKWKILLVDDSTAVANFTAAALERANILVTISNSGESALKLLRTNADEFDMVLTDYVMPDMTGLDLFEKIKKRYPNVPIAMMTGFADKNLRSIEDRLHGLLQKPFQISEVVALLEKTENLEAANVPTCDSGT